jgi:phosphatidylglycerophosphate synthase
MEQSGDRRPLASRNSRWAQAIAKWMAGRSITPNHISQASMVAAAIAGLCFWRAGGTQGGAQAGFFLLAALFCQMRLLCNLFDGMVAVEGGKGEADGPFWNEFPDRIADMLILVGAAYGAGTPAIGWAAAALAILTAYVRELGRAVGKPSDFSGPMAKQHRMAVMTLAAILSAFQLFWHGDNEVLRAGLWIVAIGSALTVLRRAYRLVQLLKAG